MHDLSLFMRDISKAYGAVTYFKHRHNISFVMAKTHVPPIKPLTLPQLELMVALIGARLLDFIHNTMKSQYDTLEAYLWSDSQIVLYWINSDKQLKPFFANRVRSIKCLSPNLLALLPYTRQSSHGSHHLKSNGLLGQPVQSF